MKPPTFCSTVALALEQQRQGQREQGRGAHAVDGEHGEGATGGAVDGDGLGGAGAGGGRVDGGLAVAVAAAVDGLGRVDWDGDVGGGANLGKTWRVLSAFFFFWFQTEKEGRKKGVDRDKLGAYRGCLGQFLSLGRRDGDVGSIRGADLQGGCVSHPSLGRSTGSQGTHGCLERVSGGLGLRTIVVVF